jgi:ABC-type multidrug transport system fused ATPase/permease subunit
LKQFRKVLYLLNSSQKKQLIILGVLLLIGTFFEMLGLGILIPGLGIILNPNIGNDYPTLKPFLKITEGFSQIEIVFWGMGLLVMVYIIKAAFLIFTTWRQSRFSVSLSAYLSKELFYGYLRQPYSFHLNRNSAQMIRNIQGEVEQFTAVSQAVINLSIEFSAIIGIAFMLLIAEPMGAIFVVSFLIISGFLFYSITKNKILAWGKKRLYHDSRISQHLIQGIGSVKDVKLFGREQYFLKMFDDHNSDKANILTKQTTLTQVPRLYLELLAVIGMASLVVMMVLQQKSLNILIPTIGVFVAAAFRMIPSVNRIMSSIQSIRYSSAVIDVLYKEFHLIRNTRSEYFGDGKIRFEDALEVNNLSFRYDGAQRSAIHKINISIAKGKTVGLIGPSGSGKSTLVDIILGLLKPESGMVTCDGVDIRLNMRDWQDHIGYVPQSIFLTDDSIRNNIAFGVLDNEIDDKSIKRCLKAAQLDDYVDTLPEGIDTFVGERGIRLSGGQRQRIGIARALYNDPPVLLLDEATSALDSDTESEVMKAVTALHGNKTIVIIAHRLSTLANCDWIYRLENGIVIQEGTPEKILDKIITI